MDEDFDVTEEQLEAIEEVEKEIEKKEAPKKKKKIIIKKQKKMKPLPDLLKDPSYGLVDIRKRCKKIVNSKAPDSQILTSLIREYRVWLSDLIPKSSFTQAIEKVEKLSSHQGVLTYLEEIKEQVE